MSDERDEPTRRATGETLAQFAARRIGDREFAALAAVYGYYTAHPGPTDVRPSADDLPGIEAWQIISCVMGGLLFMTGDKARSVFGLTGLGAQVFAIKTGVIHGG